MLKRPVIPEKRVAAVVRVTEGLICLGMLSMSAGLLHFHLQHKEVVIPKGLPDNRAVRAILRMIPDIDPVSLYLILIGAAVAGVVGFFALAFIKSSHKSKYIGMYASFALTASAWHLFRIEGQDTLDRYKESKNGVDLWSPIISNLVLLFMSMILMQHNLFMIPLFEKLPTRQGLICRVCVMAGVIFAQFYFSVLVLINFVAGLVLLMSSIVLMLFGYVGGQVWEWLLIRQQKREAAESASIEEQTPLTNQVEM